MWVKDALLHTLPNFLSQQKAPVPYFAGNRRHFLGFARHSRPHSLGGHIDGQKLDARALHWLWIQIHELHHLARHVGRHWQPELADLFRGQCVIVGPMSAREFGR